MDIKNNLIVSCQALEDEPLHSSFIMGRMAIAAKQGGAKGIRANSVEDILEIKEKVDLPIIGIIKKEYDDSNVYITPTIKEVDMLVRCEVDIIAIDATNRIRPNNLTLEDFFNNIRNKYPDVKLMADCSNYKEAIYANKLGFDYIGTTLVGYTDYTKNKRIEYNDFELIRKILKYIDVPLIAEGNIDTPEKAKRVIELGCHSVVVGSMITRPQVITEKFVKTIKNQE
ncbi:N-acetylmannosamine-6-phosphate 2-epimerase [Senegalia massiliensis]|uniref:N-acetylmannosamine-6-phosphate 2-epimerase n=1 Tax=Senegalia massiliensis TaxID=1720316 RepID=UPI001031CBB7|nr:N-acetylmannosamine-6-phosphate 2-epimerase [Senegalia massiliensis]